MLLGIQGKVLFEHPLGHTGIILDLAAFLAGEVVAVVPVLDQADLAGPVYGFGAKTTGLIKFCNGPA